ncbi:autotransporter outer membrane beta-barrel domain-containing protein, partial [Pseudomonas sp.]|uniref:autotransporter domain-containing protein n=1 Tax=Pseudomonas sp. TaxID=306 RepID=UPI00258C0B35
LGTGERNDITLSTRQLDGASADMALGNVSAGPRGTLSLDADSLGAYWTLLSPGQGYVDAVLMATRFDGQSRSVRGWTLDLHGRGTSASVEAGYPIPLTSHWALEPQAQVLVENIQLDSASDPVSRISFDSAPYWRGRVGARLVGDYQVGGVALQPWLRANLWRTFDGQDSLVFDHSDRLDSQHRASTADLGAGVSARLSPQVSLYLSLSYSQQLDSQQQQALAGTLGLRLSW